MSKLLYGYFLKKAHVDQMFQVGQEVDDPFFEEIPEEDLCFYQRKGAKRKRKLPEFIPINDRKKLEKIKKRAYRLDLQLSICGFRIGWAGIIGLLPWIGDLIALYLALRIVRIAETLDDGLPSWLRAKMMFNISFDFGIGLIPIVGDIVNIMYKCNSRNFILLEKYLMDKYSNESKIATLR